MSSLNSEDVPVDEIISTDPQAGTLVQAGDTVTLVVSNGAEEVQVPPLIGQTRDEARDTLVAAGLTLGLVDNQPSDRPEGTVISTNPSSGVSWPKGSPVDIVLSSGPTPSPVPTPSPTPVPTAVPTPTPTPEPSQSA